ncbi:hypothetical protein D3C84_1203450 [compost metagenome]
MLRVVGVHDFRLDSLSIPDRLLKDMLININGDVAMLYFFGEVITQQIEHTQIR